MADHDEPGDLDDDLPPLVGEDGEELPTDPAEAAACAGELNKTRTAATEGMAAAIRSAVGCDAGEEETTRIEETGGVSEAETIRGVLALQAAAALEAAQSRGAAGDGAQEEISAQDALRGLLAETQEDAPQAEEPDEKTKRMVQGISKDDFEEVEDAIMQGANVHADCGAGMRALHFTALRGEMFLTELLIAHGANINERDKSGNTPLLYACHFYRQHGRGVQLVSQLLYHKADPHYRVRDGKLAGKTAHDLMDKACGEPNTDENVPRQMRAMLQLAMEAREDGVEAVTKVWMQFKSQNKKLYQVSSRKDNFGYAMKSVSWETPEDAKNALGYAPVKLDENADSILEERFTYLNNYQFSDEGSKVKVYVNFPEPAAVVLGDAAALQVDFEFQALDLKLRGPSESFRLRIDPLYGTIDVSQCKHRVSVGSRKVTLTLSKRHAARVWPSVQKPR